MADYQAHLAAFAALDTEVAAVAVDDRPRARAVRRALGLGFPVLCDPERVVARAWGLLEPDQPRLLARPATVIVERGGVLGLVAIESRTERLRAADVHALLAGATVTTAPRRILVGPRTLWRVTRNVARFGWKRASDPE